MPILSCSATNCSYNENHLCARGDIHVAGDAAVQREETCCESFRDRTKEGWSNAVEHGCGRSRIGVTCDAKNCVYNEDCRCSAEDIQIEGHDACQCMDTKCDSFRRE